MLHSLSHNTEWNRSWFISKQKYIRRVFGGTTINGVCGVRVSHRLSELGVQPLFIEP